MNCRYLAAAGLLLLFSRESAPSGSPSISHGSLEVRFDSETKTCRILDRVLGPIVEKGIVRGEIDGAAYSTDQESFFLGSDVDATRRELRLRFRHNLIIRIRIPDEDRIEIYAEGPIREPAWRSVAAMGTEPMIAMLQDEQARDRGVLTTRLGAEEISGMRSLFDPDRDLAISAGPAGQVAWARDRDWILHAKAKAGKILLSLRVYRHYYRDILKIPHYSPIRKRPRWSTAPVVAMTWYGIEGWKGNPAQRKEWLFPQIDWIAERLLPYAKTMVFQLDANYPKDDDRYMREVSAYIRSKGLVPGIWFTPFVVAPEIESKQHPEWFIHDEDGKFIPTFGWRTYGWPSVGEYTAFTLNVNSAASVRNWFGMWWRKVSDAWNFDFFKIDGQPLVIDAYRRSVDGGGEQGYRKGLEIGREIVGPDKFVNACWGIPLQAMGLVDGSRTGGDTGFLPHAIQVILRWNFLNNVCWWSDPDAAANMYNASVERARLNAQARALTGQQFLTDDVWTRVPQETRRVWQQSFPTLNIYPVNLYPIEGDWRRYDLFDLRIRKPWGRRDVVGLFNYDAQIVAKVLDLSRLPLETEMVDVFDYWESTYLGRFRRDEKIARVMAAFEGELFSVTPAAGNRPVLISTSRHISQGGLDVEDLSWRLDGERWIAKGRASHLVAGNPYELTFATRCYGASSATASTGSVEMAADGGVARARIPVTEGGAAEWEVVFDPLPGSRLAVLPASCELLPGGSIQLQILSLGPKGLRWKARASDRRISVSPVRGVLDPWPMQTNVTVSVDSSGLRPGSAWDGEVVFEGEGMHPPQRTNVRLVVPPPENLALHAQASASSNLRVAGQQAPRANDGLPTTRWTSAGEGTHPSWIELVWDQPVVWSRVVIDECTDAGASIEAWRIEAGLDDLQTIARGKRLGRGHPVDLPMPVKSKRLRLWIDSAAGLPSIWEIEVHNKQASERK